MKNFHFQTRLKATFVHLVCSGIVFILTSILLIYYFFPSIHFMINGGLQGLMMMFWIDMVLGPLLTFIIFNPNKPKKEKIMDVSIVFIVQMSALMYGFYHVYQQRPSFLLLRHAGVVQTVNHQEVLDEMNSMDFSQYPKLTNLTLLSFDNQQQDVLSAIKHPQFLYQDMVSKQETILKSLDEKDKQQLENLQKNHQEKLLLIKMVGTYETATMVIKPNFELVKVLSKTKTLDKEN